MASNGYDNIKDKGFDFRSTEEVREIAKKGGINSGKTRREKKRLKEIFQMVGSLKVTDKTLYDKIKKMGIDDDEITWNTAVAVSTFLNAVRKNDVKTVAIIMEMMKDDETGKNSKNTFDEFMKDVE